VRRGKKKNTGIFNFEKQQLPLIQKSPKFYRTNLKSSRSFCNNKRPKIHPRLITAKTTIQQFLKLPRILCFGLIVTKLSKNILNLSS
jgi:hypothetical protein